MVLLKRRLMMLPKEEPYIRFADPYAEEFCVDSFGDGVGITKRMARMVTTTQFKTALAAYPDRTSVTSFDEFRYFNHVEEAGSWRGCSLLSSIILPRSCTFLDWFTFSGCTSLMSVNLDRIMKMRGGAFLDCTNLRIVVDMPFLTNYNQSVGLEYQGFSKSGITKVVNLGTVRNLGQYSFFQGCPNLTEVWLPKTIINIERFSFYLCPALESLVVLATTPPSLYNATAIGGAANRKIYVPYSDDHSILSAYKSAPSWVNLASAIYELNQDGSIPT